jgi:hypothetical protein
MIKLLRDTMRIPKEKADVHGFRSSFGVWCEEMNDFDTEAEEMCLDHIVRKTKTRRAYMRSDLLEKRRPIMAAWAAFLG